jgi:hypothetical protein
MEWARLLAHITGACGSRPCENGSARSAEVRAPSQPAPRLHVTLRGGADEDPLWVCLKDRREYPTRNLKTASRHLANIVGRLSDLCGLI